MFKNVLVTNELLTNIRYIIDIANVLFLLKKLQRLVNSKKYVNTLLLYPMKVYKIGYVTNTLLTRY